MVEYIEKETAIATVGRNTWAGFKLAEIPAADVVAVVRCRECKHSIMHKFPYNYKKVLACNDPHGVTIRAVKPMHFCANGERKDGGQDDEVT